jgi:UDP-3-O-[3-hydroxymyristoyl] glucosamine N-acyltransferase
MLEYTRPEFETQIGNNCKISSLAHVDAKNVNIGNNVIIEEFVRIKRNTQIGNNVTIRSGAVIGGDGFEYRKADNEVFFVEHVGGVIIGNNVDIFSNTCVCKAVFPWDDTIIGDYTKIDNLIHIAHCCKIGKRNVIIAGAVLCGSIETDDDVKIGPNATIAKIHMEANSNASLGAVVTKDVGQNAVVSGNFAVDHSRLLKHIKEIAGGC